MLRTLSVLASALCFLGAWQGPFWFLAWVAWIPLFLISVDDSLKQKLILFSVTGLCVYIPLMSWMIPTSIVGWLSVSCYLSLYFTAFAWFYHRWSIDAIWRLACLWVLLEMFREWFGTGLPWLTLGDSQSSQHVIRQVVDLIGVKGLSFLIMWVNLLIVLMFYGKVRRIKVAWLATILLMGTIYLYGSLSHMLMGDLQRDRESLYDVAGIHTNISLEKKWDANQLDNIIDEYMVLTRQAKADHDTLHLIVWPETAVPAYVRRRPEIYAKIASLSEELNTPLLIGSLDQGLVEGRGKTYYNSTLLIMPSAVIKQKYDKIKIVPFGEYTPWGRRFPWLREMIKGDTDFDPGRYTTLFKIGDMAWSTVICFEENFSSFVGRMLKKGAHFLVVPTNDAWFGPHHVTQRLKMTQMRAVEYRCPIIRVSNQGVSASINRAGSVLQQRANPGNVLLKIEPFRVVSTPYSRWGMLWFWILTVLVFVGQYIRNFRWRRRKVHADA